MNISESLLTGQGVTLEEAFAMGGMTTLMGLVIVFAVLVILMIILLLFSRIFHKNTVKDNTQQMTAAAEPVAEEVTAEPETDETELIAVLTAAVAASLNTSTYNLRIKSYRRAGDKRPAWNRAGLRETIESRF